MADMENEFEIRKEWETLTQETALRRVFWFQEIPSTNDFAKRFLTENGNPVAVNRNFPVLLVADRQTAGRGRGIHSWWSPEGGLFLSLIASRRDFGLTDDDSVELSLKVADGAARTAATFLTADQTSDILPGQKPGMSTDPPGSDAGRTGQKRGATVSPPPRLWVKHPNDVYFGEKKLAGILIESPTPNWVVIGIGINLNNSIASAPEEIREKTVSLIDILGVPLPPIEFVRRLTRELFGK